MLLGRELARQQIRASEIKPHPVKGGIAVSLGLIYILWLVVRVL